MFKKTKRLEERVKALELQIKQKNCTHNFRTIEVYKATSISDTIEIFADCEVCDLSIARDLKGREALEAYALLIAECK